MSPLVSVIIPCYNAERYVGDAIESALRQVYSPVEVLVVDDGSTDGSLDIIRGFGQAIHWETGPNRGGGTARNRGVTLARGDFVQFLDADDLLHPSKLARQVRLSEPDATNIVYCDWECVELDARTGRLECSSRWHVDPVILALTQSISTSAPLYPVQLLRAVGGWDESLPCAQDYDLNLRLACHGATFERIQETLMTVRRVSGSVSSNYVRVLDQFHGICWRAYGTLKHEQALTEERAKAFAAIFAAHGRTYLRFGLVDSARTRFQDALRMHPSGGLEDAYRPWSRLLRTLVGPVTTERIVQLKRRVFQGPAHGNV